MKTRIPIFVLVLIMFFSTCFVSNGFSEEKEEIITQKLIKFIGSSSKDLVTLKGIKSPLNPVYFKSLTLHIMDSKTRRSLIYPLNIDGYNPQLSFGDLNGDGGADVLVSAGTGGSGGLYNYALVTGRDNQIREIPLPPLVEVSGKLQDGYKAEIRVGDQPPFALDLSDRKKMYDEMGVYKDGKLLKNVEVMVDPYSGLEMVNSDQGGTYELQGTQRVSTFAHYDGILDVISTWKWEDGHWSMKNVVSQQLR